MAAGDSLDRLEAPRAGHDPENPLRSDPNVAPRADATATATRADAFKSWTSLARLGMASNDPRGARSTTRGASRRWGDGPAGASP